MQPGTSGDQSWLVWSLCGWVLWVWSVTTLCGSTGLCQDQGRLATRHPTFPTLHPCAAVAHALHQRYATLQQPGVGQTAAVRYEAQWLPEGTAPQP
jgi:hypothetical protein